MVKLKESMTDPRLIKTRDAEVQKSIRKQLSILNVKEKARRSSRRGERAKKRAEEEGSNGGRSAKCLTATDPR
jgi:hypothetical protein